MARKLTSSESNEQLVWLLFFVAFWRLIPVSPTLCMLLISASMFLLIKIHCLALFSRENPLPGLADTAQWFLWVGLKPEAFFAAKEPKQKKHNELVAACVKIFVGLGLIASSAFLRENPITAAWLLWTGFGFVLHFGIFHLQALYFQSKGRNVVPIMKAPLLSRSVSEFWGKRWNLAFRDYAHRTLFKPLSKRYSPTVATMAGFFFSGLVHEIAISVPAHGGYGLPMFYFLLQGVALITERKYRFLKSGWRGHAWTVLCVLLPAPLLFHSKFMTSVVFPIVKLLADSLSL